MIDGQLQNTSCRLLINANDGDLTKLFRANCDFYPNRYSFSDLPEIPLADKNLQKARLKMCNPSSFP